MADVVPIGMVGPAFVELSCAVGGRNVGGEPKKADYHSLARVP